MPETKPQLTESEIDRLANRGLLRNFSGLANLSIAERDALIRDWRAMKAANETLGEVGLRNAQLIDRVRAWSKCPDGYPLDEHINNIATQNAALRKQLAKAQRVIDAARALHCAGCAANLPLEGSTHKPTAEQVKLGYEPAECEAKGAARVSNEIREALPVKEESCCISALIESRERAAKRKQK